MSSLEFRRKMWLNRRADPSRHTWGFNPPKTNNLSMMTHGKHEPQTRKLSIPKSKAPITLPKLGWNPKP